LQFLLIASLTLAQYLVLKLHHHRPVLHPLGWIWPRPVYVLVSLTAGTLLASGVALYLRYCHRSTLQIGLIELLFWALHLAQFLRSPSLEDVYCLFWLRPAAIYLR
jgi:hypothetical protein